MDVAAGTDNATLHVFVNSVSAFETNSQSITAAARKNFQIDILLDLTNGDVVEIYAENEDTTANLDASSGSQGADVLPPHGFLIVTGG